ncbi:putative bifunctional diguanylate cyclase/phosphodiesterase [Actinoplanes sp. NPDC049599]|uniref:putative bifunctional diguanylate cyclase/phosphodiesterase n=1 Tax=Actinoplanes sp. NPDC049599 TaxID=3363903 RepID=UPI0037A7436C
MRVPPHQRTVLAAATVLVVLGVVAWAVDAFAGSWWPAPVTWVFAPAAAALGAVLCRRAATAFHASGTVSAYWRTSSLGMMTFAVAYLLRVVDAVSPADGLIWASVAVHVVGAGLMVWPLLRLPSTVATGAARAALWLDIGILMSATGVLIWCFTATWIIGAFTAGHVVIVAALVASGLGGVFFAARIALVGVEGFSRRSLYAIGVAGICGGAGVAACMLLPGGLRAGGLALLVPISSYVTGLAAHWQIVDAAAATPPAVRRRNYSLLPYGAVAAVDVMLVYTAARGTFDHLVIDSMAFLLTGLVIVRQVTALRANTALLHRIGDQKEHFRLLVQNATDIVTITEPDGTLRYASPAMMLVLGRDPDACAGTNLLAMVHPEDVPVVEQAHASIMDTAGASVRFAARLRHADGSWRWLELFSSNLLHEPSIAGRVSNARDITETREIQERLRYEAGHDPLTGLANRLLFTDRIDESVAAADQRRQVCVALIDLDDFKSVNDTLGHAVGDRLLVALAERMREAVRPTDLVARLGGDEFAFVFCGAPIAAVEDVLGRVDAALRVPIRVGEHVITTRASFGIAECRPGDDAGEVLRRADVAMYAAKADGGGRIRSYTAELDEQTNRQARLTAELRVALDTGQFRVVYQPIVSLPDGRIVSVEALVRWEHPERGLISPAEFIPVAEHNGLIVELGAWVLRTACAQTVTWRAELGDAAPQRVSVNVSARQLAEPGFVALVSSVLAWTGLGAHNLVVEVTETAVFGGGQAVRAVKDLHELGVLIALDDFGTGHSSLGLLRTVPVDMLKVDKSFVDTITMAGQHAVIATALIQVSHGLGLSAVAEGVETAEQAAELYRLGYRLAQGYHFGRPVAEPDFRGVRVAS